MSTPRRTCVYVGADGPDLDALAESARPDVMLVDLEDAVAADRKGAARERTARFLAGSPRCEVFVRVNALDGEHVAADLALCAERPTAIVVPMLRRVEEVREADRLIGAAEAEAGVPAGAIGLVCMLETPRAVLRALDLLEASPRVSGAVFGPNDYVAECGSTVIGGAGFAYHGDVGVAHALVVAAASAVGVPCMTPTLNRLDDLDELERQARDLYARGYDAVIGLDADQIRAIERAARPGPEATSFARGIVDAFDSGAQGSPNEYDGWFVYEGPFLTMARQALEAARRHA